MKVQTESQMFKIICISLLALAGVATSQNAKCPFQYLYHFGDGFTDIGNSIHVLPYGTQNPASRWPYGKTTPGHPTGRWSDGLNDFDFAATDFGLPNITPYLSMNISKSNDGVIFSVANSPVLDRKFFTGIRIPLDVVPLNTQMHWFRTYLNSVCSTKEDRAARLASSLVLFGDIQGHDIGYALSQGKSIEEVKTYVPYVVDALVSAAKDAISMGATKIIIPENTPLGCYPYILTVLPSDDPTAYDDMGCLKSVNDLVLWKNSVLRQAVEKLGKEYPNLFINFGTIYDGVMAVMNDAFTGPNGKLVLKACCGIGGKYNFNSRRLCGSPGVPVCDFPNQYIFWDGMHFTQQAYARVETILVRPALVTLNCTTPVRASM